MGRLAKNCAGDKQLAAAIVNQMSRRPFMVRTQTGNPMLRLVLLIILVLALLGSVPMWGYSAGWGYGPSGGLGLLLIILLILVVTGRL
jgi:hypothetical protein